MQMDFLEESHRRRAMARPGVAFAATAVALHATGEPRGPPWRPRRGKRLEDHARVESSASGPPPRSRRAGFGIGLAIPKAHDLSVRRAEAPCNAWTRVSPNLHGVALAGSDHPAFLHSNSITRDLVEGRPHEPDNPRPRTAGSRPSPGSPSLAVARAAACWWRSSRPCMPWPAGRRGRPRRP